MNQTIPSNTKIFVKIRSWTWKEPRILHSTRRKHSIDHLTLQEKWPFACLWFRSRIRAHYKHSKAEKLLDLSQYIFLWHQFSSSHLHFKLTTMKVLSDLSLDKPSFQFLVIAHMKQQTFCSQLLWNGKERLELLRPLLSLSASCGWLGWLSQGMASSGQICH